MGKVQSLTYLCNLPDTYWRGLKEASSGTSSHFFETDPTELSFEKVPLDYKTFEDWAAGQKNKFKDKPILFPAKELGSSWWRADQFYRRALAAAKEASSKTNSDPQHSKELFEMVAMMGLMGHFIGDISQPLHNTSNYDGWSNGHGGLHGYFETELVNQLPPSLLADIVARGPVAKKELSLETKKSRVLLEQLQALAVLSFSELEKLWVLDPLLKKSDLQSKKGLELKSPAQRKDPALAAGAFRKIIIGEMARSAVLLAATWDRIYKEGHSPDLKSDRSFDFPHQYPFIPPDYVSRKDL